MIINLILKNYFQTHKELFLSGVVKMVVMIQTGVSSNPEYGKVFISIKSTTGENLTTVQKSNLVRTFAPYKVRVIRYTSHC